MSFYDYTDSIKLILGLSQNRCNPLSTSFDPSPNPPATSRISRVAIVAATGTV